MEFFFYLRDDKGWEMGNLKSSKIPFGPLGLPWLDLTVLTGVDGPTRLPYSLYVVQFLSLYSLALTGMFLRDIPLLYDKRGGSLKISFNLGWFCIRCHFSLSMFLRPGSAGQYCVSNGNVFFRAV